MIGRLLGILCLSLLLASGCSRSDHDQGEILQIITTRANALNSRDISRYISVVSPQYNDKGKSFAELKENLEKNFRVFEQISYEAETPEISVDGNRARSVAAYRMKILVRGKEMTLNGTERLRLTKEPEGWKIIGGL